jgi:hypothetical protein
MVYLSRVVFILSLFSFLLVACGQEITPTSETTLLIATNTKTITPHKPTLTPSVTYPFTSTPSRTATLDRIWYATAISIKSTDDANSKTKWSNKATQVAQFPVPCNNVGSYSNSISPDGKWSAMSCGSDENQTLIVQNKEGTKWILKFIDFLESKEWASNGRLAPKSWSPDNNYLYFISELGFDGGGNECFPSFSWDYGLFRLNLKTGTWVTLIPTTLEFSGHGIEFSPTGRRYTTNINGVTITDLKTGEVYNFMEPDTIEGFSWSSDGKHLAYTTASCGEFFVESSSLHIWDALTNQTEELFTTQGIKLIPESWDDNNTLRVRGEQFIDKDYSYTTYLYDLQQGQTIFTGTATPSP